MPLTDEDLDRLGDKLEETPATAADTQEQVKQDLARGRRLRGFYIFCGRNPTLVALILGSAIFGRHQAMQILDLEPDPVTAQAQESKGFYRLTSEVDDLKTQVQVLNAQMGTLSGQLKDLQKDVLEVALKQTSGLDADKDPAVADTARP